MKLIIAGSRDFDDIGLLYNTLAWVRNDFEVNLIVSGHARGADQLGEAYADEFGIPISLWYADWKQYGKAAGALRNEQMAQEGTALVAFPKAGSKGTLDMVNRAMAHRLNPIVVVWS